MFEVCCAVRTIVQTRSSQEFERGVCTESTKYERLEMICSTAIFGAFAISAQDPKSESSDLILIASIRSSVALTCIREEAKTRKSDNSLQN